MTFDTTWDVDKYKYKYELDHQWKLKKVFLEAHKDKYPENRLICLAQTFINIHYLGCRYDKPIMDLIESLSEGLAEKNEKWEKESFVAASHAVEERVAARLSGPYKPPVQNKFVNFMPQGSSKDDEETGTKRKIELDEETIAKKTKLDEASEKAKKDMQFVVDSGPFGKFVLFENVARTDGSISVIERTAHASQVTPDYQFTTLISRDLPHDCNVRRGGLGIRNFFDFKNKVGSLIKDFAHGNSKEDLVFSPEFSKDERKAIHELVRKYGLKSKSYGKEEDSRRIVVFKKIRPLEIVEDLLMCGGKTDKYELIPPESMKDKF